MNVLLTISQRWLTRSVMTLGLLLLFCFSTSYAEENKGISFDIPGLEGGRIQFDLNGRYQLSVQPVAIKKMTDSQFAVLRQYDELLQKKTDAESLQKSHALVIAMARAGNVKSLLYLHEQFETHPERRNNIAEGLSYYAREQKLRDSDWRLMVRSLNVVEGKQAVEVIQAMQRYRRRANKSQWIRQLILVGLTLDEKGATEAITLLKHWTGQDVDKEQKDVKQKLKSWQKWFHIKYPEEPAAKISVDAKESKWKYAELRKTLKKHQYDKVDLVKGKKVFSKASCFKCHRLGEEGEKIGPNLSNIGKKMQEKEILHAILFPSHFIPEEYPTTTLQTKDGKTYVGMMGRVGPETLLILKLDGKKEFINQKNVQKILPNKISAMPEKLLEGLSQEEIIHLFAYIQSFAKDGTVTFHKAP